MVYITPGRLALECAKGVGMLVMTLPIHLVHWVIRMIAPAREVDDFFDEMWELLKPVFVMALLISVTASAIERDMFVPDAIELLVVCALLVAVVVAGWNRSFTIFKRFMDKHCPWHGH